MRRTHFREGTSGIERMFETQGVAKLVQRLEVAPAPRKPALGIQPSIAGEERNAGVIAVASIDDVSGSKAADLERGSVAPRVAQRKVRHALDRGETHGRSAKIGAVTLQGRSH